MAMAALFFGIAVLMLHEAHSNQIAYDSECHHSQLNASPSLMVKPEMQTYAPAPSSVLPPQQFGPRFVEVAVITAPTGQSDAIPETAPAPVTVAARPKPKPKPFNDHNEYDRMNDDDDGNDNGRRGRGDQVDIKVSLIVDDQHELFFNGKPQGWKDGGYTKKYEYEFKDVKSGDVLAIEGKDRQGYAGILAQIEYLSGPAAGSKHVTEAGWTCSRHNPNSSRRKKNNSWMTNGFSNTGDVRTRFLDAEGHGKVGAWPWRTQGDIKDFDPAAVWFWVEHNFLMNQAWCRYEFDFNKPQDDTGNSNKDDNGDDDGDDDDDKGEK